MARTWEVLGELTVSNNWQLYPVSTLSEVFRVTATITNQTDWELWKFRSNAKLRFYYANGFYSPEYYLPVPYVPTVREYIIPQEFKDEGWVIRDVGIIRASRFLPRTPDEMFAEWKLKIEALL